MQLPTSSGTIYIYDIFPLFMQPWNWKVIEDDEEADEQIHESDLVNKCYKYLPEFTKASNLLVGLSECGIKVKLIE